MNNVFGLDIGTRNVIGTVGYRTDNDEFIVVAQYIKQHDTRAMLDGQIHDIGKVAKTINSDFSGGWGSYVEAEAVIDFDECGTHTVEIKPQTGKRGVARISAIAITK